MAKPEGTPPPRGAHPNSLTTKTSPRVADLLGDSDVARKVRLALSRMSGIGDRSEHDYQEALRELRTSTDSVARIAEVYQRLPLERRVERWSLIQLLADLRDPSAVGFLDSLLNTPMPGMASEPPPHDDQSRLVPTSGLPHEVIILTTAIEAVTRLATDGDSAAGDILLKHTRHAVYSVRRAAIGGYLESHPDDGRAALEKVVTEGDRHLLDASRRDVREFPQPRPEFPPAKPDRHVVPPPHR